MTAPVGEVTTPIVLGKKGSLCLLAEANRPSFSSFRRVFSKRARSSPSPAITKLSMIIWYFDRPAYVVILPVATTSNPSSGRKGSLLSFPAHYPVQKRFFVFRARYCPDAARLTPDSSPRKRTKPKLSSTVLLKAKKFR